TVALAGSYTVTGQTSIQGGTARFDVPATLGNVDLSYGAIDGSGNLTINGTFNWTRGDLHRPPPTTLTPPPTLLLNDPPPPPRTPSGCLLGTQGSGRWQDSGCRALRNGALFDIAAGGSLDVQGSASLYDNTDYNSSGTPAALQNAGAFSTSGSIWFSVSAAVS